MSDMKEPGQVMWEQLWKHYGCSWANAPTEERARYAAVEAAVRAAALEEAAREAERHPPWQIHERTPEEIAAAIRTLSPSPAAPLILSVSGQSETPPAAEDQG